MIKQGDLEGLQKKMIGFPKILIFELVDYPCEYPKYYIRIYEKRQLDGNVLSKNVYLHVKGCYIPVRDTATLGEDQDDAFKISGSSKEEYQEKVS